MPLPRKSLEKAREKKVAKELLRTVPFGRKVSARRVPSAPANVMMLKREPPVADHPLPLQQGVELNQEEEGTGKVVVVPPVPRAVPSLRVEDHCSVEGLVDPSRDLVRLVRGIRDVESTLASEATQEQKVARVRDTSKTSVTQGGA